MDEKSSLLKRIMLREGLFLVKNEEFTMVILILM